MKVLKTVLLAGLCLVIGGVLAWRVQVYRFNKGVQNVEEGRAKRLAKQAALNAGIYGIPAEAQGKLSIFILAGQSNMSGRGVLPEKPETNSRVFMLGNDGRWKLACEPVDNPVGQIDEVSIDPAAGVSPGMTFAQELLKEYPDMYIGLVPVAKGASTLYQWRRDLSDTTLYGSFLKRAKAATALGEIKGFLWFQGEDDARDASDPKQPLGPKWNEGFELLAKNVRQDLGLPNLPVVYGQIGTHKDPVQWPRWDLVKESQKKVKLQNCAMITSEDLPIADRVHFTADSFREIGKRLGKAYIGLQKKTAQ